MLKLLEPIIRNIGFRYFSLSSASNVKEIVTLKTGNVTVIKGNVIPSEREAYMVKAADSEKDKACPVCKLGLDIKHTDVLILSQFLRSDGCMLPRRITGLCGKQQKRMTIMVAMAQKAGLMSNLNPPNSKKDPKKRYQHKRFNHYFDETTIKTKGRSTLS